MKNLLLIAILSALALMASAQTKLFAVNNNGTTAWTVQFADAATKDKAIQAICDAFDYDQATAGMANPPSKNQFAQTQVQHTIKEMVKKGRQEVARKAVTAPDESDLPPE